MSSERTVLIVTAAVLLGACAGFERGEYWEPEAETTSTSGAVSTSAGPGGTSAGQTETGTDPGDGSSGSSGGMPSISYAEQIHDILVAGCERCHSPDGTANGTGLVLLADNPDASYEAVLRFVDVGDPAASRLLGKGAGMGHGGGTVYDVRSDEYAQIRAWIEGGAVP